MIKFFFFISAITLMSCGGHQENMTSTVDNKNPSADTTIFTHDEAVLINSIDTLQTDSIFIDQNLINWKLEVLEKIGICDKKLGGFDSLICNTENYHLFQFHELYPEKSIKAAFLLLIKGDLFKYIDQTYRNSIDRILIFEKEENQWVFVNSFVGNICEKINHHNGLPESLIVEFNYLQDDVFFYCLFDWENGKYEFQSCERISYDYGETTHNILESQKMDVNLEVKNILYEQKYFQ